MPEQNAAGRPDDGGLLERGDELEALNRAVRTCLAGHGGVVMVRGAAGTGKTVLLDGAAEVAEESGLLVLRARATEFEREFPFGAARQLIQPVLSTASRGERGRIFSGAATLARPMFANALFAPDDREDRASEMVEGFAWAIANLAVDRDVGIILIVDDAHTCDRESLRALVRIALRAEEMGTLLVLAMRPTDESRERDLLDWLTADPASTLLDVGALSSSGVATLVAREMRREASAEFVTACLQVTGGNPFLTRELLAELVKEGISPDASAASRVGDMVPDRVLRTVNARVSALGAPARSLANAIAVLGTETPMRLAAALSDLPHREAYAAARLLASAGVLTDTDPVSFSHPLVASAVARDCTAIEWAEAHANAARLLADDGARPERIATHLLESSPNNDPKVVAVLRAAAAETTRKGGSRGAVAFLRRALAESPNSVVRTVVELELAHAEAAAGDPAATQRLTDVLGAELGIDDRVLAMKELARLQFLNQHQREAALTIQRLMAEVGPAHPLEPGLRAEFLSYAGVGSSTTDPELRNAAGHYIVDLIERVQEGSQPEHVALLVQLGTALGAGRAPRAMLQEVMGQALAREPLEHVPPIGIVSTTAVVALTCADELGLADELADRCWSLARQTESIHGSGQAAFCRALVAYERGDLDRAVEYANNALDFALSGAPIILIWSACILVDALRLQGQLDSAHRALALATRSDEDHVMHGIGLYSRAELSLATGDYEAAWTDAHAAADALARFDLRDYPMFPWRLTAARAAFATGPDRQAHIYVDEELALSHGSDVNRTTGRALVTKALLARGSDDEVALLVEATKLLEDSHARHLCADAQLQLGEVHRRRGDTTAAELALRRSLDLADLCGAEPIAKQARAGLRAVGRRPRVGPREGADSLTPSERRVAMAVAQERTNREIATELHVTVSTVEYHLTNAYRKLGVNSRADLKAAMQATAGTPPTR
ncbi:MAG: hypothetical protein QOG80_2519 [Pseudonocardiales bacterium]|nr:hypothetical protein [Pseudonocardiales bacterium]